MVFLRVSLLIVSFCGLFATFVSAYYLRQDWATLNASYARFEKLVMSAAPMRSLFIAESVQNAFRVNCFADGVGVLLGGILFAIGVHGLSAHYSTRRA